MKRGRLQVDGNTMLLKCAECGKEEVVAVAVVRGMQRIPATWRNATLCENCAGDVPDPWLETTERGDYDG